MVGKKRKSTSGGAKPGRKPKAHTVEAVNEEAPVLDFGNLDSLARTLWQDVEIVKVDTSTVSKLLEKLLSVTQRKSFAKALHSKGYFDQYLVKGLSEDAPTDLILSCMVMMTFNTDLWHRVERNHLELLFSRSNEVLNQISNGHIILLMEWLQASLLIVDLEKVKKMLESYFGLGVWYQFPAKFRQLMFKKYTSVEAKWNEKYANNLKNDEPLKSDSQLCLSVLDKLVSLCVGVEKDPDLVAAILAILLFFQDALRARDLELHISALFTYTSVLTILKEELTDFSKPGADQIEHVLQDLRGMVSGAYRVLSNQNQIKDHNASVQELQQHVFILNPKLSEFSFASIGKAQDPSFLRLHLSELDIDMLLKLVSSLGYSWEENENLPVISDKLKTLFAQKKFVLELLVSKYQSGLTVVQTVEDKPAIPTEAQLWPRLLPTYTAGGRALGEGRPMMEYSHISQTLHVGLQRVQSLLANEIKLHLETHVLHSKKEDSDWTMPIKTFRLLPIPSIRIGDDSPEFVHALVQVGRKQGTRLPNDVTYSWESQKPGDKLLLVTLFSKPGTGTADVEMVVEDAPPMLLRGCSVVRENQRGSWNVALEPKLYQRDRDAAAKLGGGSSIYDSFDLIVRVTPRMARLIDLSQVLKEAIARESSVLPGWFLSSFLSATVEEPSSLHSLVTPMELGKVLGNADSVAAAVRHAGATPDVQATGSGALTLRPSDGAPDSLTVAESSKFRGTASCSEGSMTEVSQDLGGVLLQCTRDGLTLVDAPECGAGSEYAAKCAALLVLNSNGRIAVMARTRSGGERFLRNLETEQGGYPCVMVPLLRVVAASKTDGPYSAVDRVNGILSRRMELLKAVASMASSLQVEKSFANSCDNAARFYVQHLERRMTGFRSRVKKCSDASSMMEYVEAHYPVPSLAPKKFATDTEAGILDEIECSLDAIENVFSELKEYRVFELIRGENERVEYVLNTFANIVVTSYSECLTNKSLGRFRSLICMDSSQISDEEFLASTYKLQSEYLDRIVCFGRRTEFPVLVSETQSCIPEAFSVWERLGVLNKPFTEFVDFRNDMGPVEAFYVNQYGKQLSPTMKLPVSSNNVCAGFKMPLQVVNCGKFESKDQEHAITWNENQEEAEYAVALYQYMRLIAYNSEDIQILCTTTTQKTLIKKTLEERCGPYAVLSPYCHVNTVSEFQGCKAPFVIFSTVLRGPKQHTLFSDERYWSTVFASAKDGLFILGEKESLCKIETVKDLVTDGTLELALGEGFGHCTRNSNTDEIDNPYQVTDGAAMRVLVAQLLQQIV